MSLKPYEKLPKKMQNNKTKYYYEILKNKTEYLLTKRVLDIILSLALIIILLPIFIITAISIKVKTGDNPIFKQVRIKQYMESFNIYKFKTMKNSSKKSPITVNNDERVTEIGAFLRKTRLDELPQLFNILKGDMSFVGARPEIPIYVDKYDENMTACFLMPVGLTSEASIAFKDESKMLNTENYEEIYTKFIIPKKMKMNLDYIPIASIYNDFKIMVKTLHEMLN